MKIGVVFNPFAGSNRRLATPRQHELTKIVGRHGLIRITDSLETLQHVAKEFFEEKIDVLAISGGDGTNQHTLTVFRKVYGETPLPILALLRGGTMNLLETSLGLYGTPEKRLTRIVKVLQETGKCPVIGHDLLQVNDRVGFIFGNGVIANFLKAYYEGAQPNLGKILRVLGKAISSAFTDGEYVKEIFRPVAATVQVEEKTLPEQQFCALMAATERECGLGFKPCYRAREKSGHLHFLAVNISPLELLRNLPRIRVGKPIDCKTVHDIVTQHVFIETHKPYYYTVDGELLNSTNRINLSAGPRVKIIAL